ncbi:MAG: NAD-dependent epimerase/dehydratase family protein [Candidatus Aminicenantes bacterium]|nr:MAG: NAD-dependent epimerase/dehydratase family protein [Candidatus Aminicenantes bacterium]
MKVLVTGGTGFIGSRLVERLVQQGHEVRLVAKDRLNSVFLESLGIELVLGDLNDGMNLDAMVEDAECIYHLAGMVRARFNRDYYEGNYLATKNFLKVCARSSKNLKRFVFVSSLAAAGPSRNGKLLTEDAPCRPVSHYGRSKMLAEEEVLRYRDKLPVTIVRPSAVYGPRDREMYQYILLVKKHLQPLVGFGTKWLNLIYVDDLAEGLLLAGEHPNAEDETFFIASEAPYATAEMGNAIAAILDLRPIPIHIPHFVVFSVGAIGEGIAKLTGKPIFFTIQKARESVQPGWICSVQKAKSRLGFSQRVSLLEGMRRTYRWYEESGWL